MAVKSLLISLFCCHHQPKAPLFALGFEFFYRISNIRVPKRPTTNVFYDCQRHVPPSSWNVRCGHGAKSVDYYDISAPLHQGKKRLSKVGVGEKKQTNDCADSVEDVSSESKILKYSGIFVSNQSFWRRPGSFVWLVLPTQIPIGRKYSFFALTFSSCGCGRHKEVEEKLTSMKVLSPDEQLFYDSVDIDLLTGKATWLTSAVWSHFQQ